MTKRHPRKAGLLAGTCAPSFCGTGITEYLRNGGDLKVGGQIAGHDSTIAYARRSRSTRSSASKSERIGACRHDSRKVASRKSAAVQVDRPTRSNGSTWLMNGVMQVVRFLLGPVAALLLVTAGLPPAAAQTFDEAVEAYHHGDYATALRGFRVYAEQGNASAQFNLALMYKAGEGVPQDYAEAARWYRQAAEQGDADAQFSIAIMYDNGQGVPQNDVEAVRWYRQAAEQGNASAQFNLALMYKAGEGVPQDYAEAARWYRQAAEQGDADAQFSIAIMYDNGQGVPQNDVEAVRWYRQAAEQGNASAQFNLALMYKAGEGVPQDYAEAARWYRQAAEQGNASAQFNLAIMYDNGQGVPQNDVEAVRWYRQAAEQGNASAQFNLALMYEYGEGVLQNLGYAHKWFNLAASLVSSQERELREMAVEARDRVAAQLTAGDLAIAQRLAREWQPRKSGEQRPVQEEPPPQSTVFATEVDESGNAIVSLQRSLLQLGYYAGPLDGNLDAKTRLAIRAFEADSGLPITGQVSEILDAAVKFAVLITDTTTTVDTRSLQQESTGSGFYVSPQGHVLTNAHVVQECTEVRIPSAGRVQVLAQEDSTDLALLQAQTPMSHTIAAFRQGRGIRPGASVVVVGYPLRGLLASGANVSTGAVSALAGPGDDRRLIQITAPVQPGNSGGPVLDAAANVVGVVVSKLDALKIAESTGDIPQNVNFAISAGTARAFLDDQSVPYETAPSNQRIEPAEAAAAAKKFTVLVECWN